MRETPTSSKSALRTQLRAARKAITAAQRSAAAHDAAKQFLRSRKLTVARRIAVYHTHGSELDTAPLIDALAVANRQVFLPAVRSHGVMRFVRARPAARLRRAQHGIAKPASGAAIRWTDLDLIVVPLLAFDAHGRRLGSGAGYYDRLLGRPRPFRRPLVVGYAYALQQQAELPEDPWDRKLDAVATERGVTWFTRS